MGFFVFAIIITVLSVIFLFFGKSFNMKPGFHRYLGIAGFCFAFLFFILSMLVVIDAGEVGVVVVFGKVEKRVLHNGINFVLPYANVYKYSTRVAELTQSEANIIEARVNNGLLVKLDCTLLFSINPEKVNEIYSKFAQSSSELQSKILLTTLRTVIRNVVSKYASEEVYSSKREQVSTEIENAMRETIAEKGILIDKFFIRAINLPEEVDKAIQLKISAQQEAEAMTFRKQKSLQEAEIKVIEAEGLAKAQRIINSTLTPNYLQHEAIQAYKELVNSQNTTFVIMPTSPNATGIPLIINGTK